MQCDQQRYTLFISNLVQGLVPKVPYFWTSNDQVIVLKVREKSVGTTEFLYSTKKRHHVKAFESV